MRDIVVLFSLVASHADIDLETVARLSAGTAEVPVGIVENTPEIEGAVALATCNRFEIYVQARRDDDVEAARSAVISAISDKSGLTEHTVSKAFETRHGPAVPKHLFTVSAGLDSAVVGEREIAGQVRRALSTAQQDGSASPALVRLFQAASKTAKDVGSQTALGSRGMSIVSVALDLAAELNGGDQLAPAASFAGRKAVLFGTGAYAGATMAQLVDRGCTDVSVYSSSGRAETFVASRGGTALTGLTLPTAIAGADLLIGCSGSENQIEAGEIARVRQNASGPLTILDLALTHDFDPAVDQIPGVDLLTLETVRLAAPAEQAASVAEAGSIVAKAAKGFEQAQTSRSMDSAIVALRKHTMSVLDSELERVRAQHGCTAAAEEVEFAMRRMVKSLLHIPTVRARELAAAGQGDNYLAALDALFGITVEPITAEPAAVQQGAAGRVTAESAPHAETPASAGLDGYAEDRAASA